MPKAKKHSFPDADRAGASVGGWSALAFGAAVELDLFTIIHRGKTTAAEIATEANTYESSTCRLLDVMVVLNKR